MIDVSGFNRRNLIAGMVLSMAPLLQAGGIALTEPAGSSSLAGQLLIAAPANSDPRFYQTVVLMVRHDRNGAFGIAINRPIAERPLKSILEALGDSDPAIEGSVRIFAGGPVQPGLGFVLHSTDYRRPETVDIDGRVAMTSSRDILRDIGANRGPAKTLVAFGYAGWAPGQLEQEMRNGFWFTAEEDAKLVFDQDRDKVWDDAMARRTQDL